MRGRVRALVWATLVCSAHANFVAKYTMYCEAAETCELPNPSATDNTGASVAPVETTYKLLANGNREEVSSGISKADFSKPATYLVEYRATSATINGNAPETYAETERVDIDVIVQDTKPPTITLCGATVQHIEAYTSWLPCLSTTASDTVDGDLTHSMVQEIEKPDKTRVPFIQSNYENIATKPGKYKLLFSVADSSGNGASAEMIVYVLDNAAPEITVMGSQPVVQECTNVYKDAGARGWDREDGLMPTCGNGQTLGCVNSFGGFVRSCKEIKNSFPDSKSGMYNIDHPLIAKLGTGHTGAKTLNVYCDMEADGGGYTYYPIDSGGISVRKIDEVNSCTALGLQMAIFRSEAQITNLFAKYGASYFSVAGGIFGTAQAMNKDLSGYALNSDEAEVAQVFKAEDNGKWYIKSDKQTWTGSDYNPGCLLGLYGSNPISVRPASATQGQPCGFETGTQYVCSTNDKGGVGVLGDPVAGLAVNFPDYNKVGRYGITYGAKDSAGNLAEEQHRVVEVRDTTKPVITLKGQPVVIQHVNPDTDATPYQLNDAGVTCVDACDKAMAGCGAPTCTDPSKCTVITGSGGEKLHSVTCQAEATRDEVLNITWTSHLDVHKIGRYVREYTCTDLSGNSASVTREFYLVAPTEPILSVVGDNPVTLEAEKNSPYIDKGARCVDAAGNGINDLVSTTGQVVNREKPGVYNVYYSCADRHGRKAQGAARTVIVRDTTCPNIILKSGQMIIIEAGFDWIDPGAVATDNIDGEVTSRLWLEGDTVDVSAAYYSRGSCMQILEDERKDGKTPKSGYYYITVAVSAAKKSKRVRVWCDMITDGGGYTMFQSTGGLRTSRASDPNSCADVGMEIVVPRTEGHFNSMLRKFGTEYFQIVPGIVGNADTSMAGQIMKSTTWSDPQSANPTVDDVWKALDGGDWYIRDTAFTEPHGMYMPGCWMEMDKWQQGNYHFATKSCDYSTNTYICSTNDKGGPSPVANNKVVNAYPAGAEKGKYVISYHVTDKAGNRECKVRKRTVLVKDTLAPVITVKIGDTVKVAGVLKDKMGNVLSGSGMSQVKADEKVKSLAVATAAAMKANAANRRLLSEGVTGAMTYMGLPTTLAPLFAFVAVAGTAMFLAAVTYPARQDQLVQITI